MPAEVSPLQRAFSKEDWVLLDAMGTLPTPQNSGKFLTMHKRRRKRLCTRSLTQDYAILDDIHHGLVQVTTTNLTTCMLSAEIKEYLIVGPPDVGNYLGKSFCANRNSSSALRIPIHSRMFLSQEACLLPTPLRLSTYPIRSDRISCLALLWRHVQDMRFFRT